MHRLAVLQLLVVASFGCSCMFLCFCRYRPPLGVNIWKAIMKGCGAFAKLIYFVLGDGHKD